MEDHPYRRAVARLTTEYVASLLSDGMAETGLDILDFTIVMMVATNNIAHLKSRTAESVKAGGPDFAVPPEMMTPVSRTSIAEAMKLPYETARRRIKALVESGVLVAVGGNGVIIGQRVTSSRTSTRIADKNLAMTRRFVKQLIEAGLDV